jgi:hypothetical protein
MAKKVLNALARPVEARGFPRQKIPTWGMLTSISVGALDLNYRIFGSGFVDCANRLSMAGPSGAIRQAAMTKNISGDT